MIRSLTILLILSILGCKSEDQNKLFVGMLIMLIFSEALALYGMIVALIVSQHSYSCETS